jgi:hypothetical protein
MAKCDTTDYSNHGLYAELLVYCPKTAPDSTFYTVYCPYTTCYSALPQNSAIHIILIKLGCI